KPAANLGLGSKALEEQLEKKEIGSEFGTNTWMRQYSLRAVHESAVDHFVRSPGFGMTRMPRLSPRDIEIHDAGPIPLPAPFHQDPPGQEEAAASYAQALPSVPADQRPANHLLEQLHGDGYVDFLNPKRYGYVESREYVIGFRPHQFAD